MKLKNILFTGVTLLTLTACNDYLEVDAPSAYTEEFVFGQKSEMTRALNGVYAQILSNNLYGDAYQKTFVLNSDVDMQINTGNTHSHTTYARLDCDAQGSQINSFWVAAYNAIEYANRFIEGAENSQIYSKSDTEIMQMIGEAKCLRAMVYHDLVVMFGDIPFTMKPAASLGTDYIVPIADRKDVQDAIIADLKEAQMYMQPAKSVTVERASKEFAQAMIARIALTAGGYSLRPDKNSATSYGTMQRPDNYKEYYQIARDYADSVITAGGHSATSKTFQQEFVDECNYIVDNAGDPIFEIPFAKESSGNVGYTQGPTYSSNEGKTVGSWGECGGSARLNAFYRFLFQDDDLRREFVNGLWYYSYVQDENGNLKDTVYIRNDYTVHNNKWSKLWTDESKTLGNDKSGSTGINFPYMRYCDVLLMFAEADNEINEGPTAKAGQCLAEVHKRGFPTTTFTGGTSKQDFLEAVLRERMWEFAGENMRWRDLVRNNMYGKELVYSFLRYQSAALQSQALESNFEAEINAHDAAFNNKQGYITKLPVKMRYHVYDPTTEADVSLKSFSKGSPRKTMYGCVISGYDDTAKKPIYDRKYPNSGLKAALRIYNPYEKNDEILSDSRTITTYGFKATSWNSASFYNWGNEDGSVKDQCKYSFFGYVRSDDSGNMYLIENGTIKELTTEYLDGTKELPAVRYILPYPNAAIQRSNGAYKNYYGY